MKLFIANTTKQHHHFNYRHPEMGARSLMIKAGTQINFDVLSTDDIDSIVSQYRIYGMQNADEISRLKGFVGFSYRVDKPVPIKTMLELFDKNDKAMDANAKERVMVEAVAVGENIAEKLHQQTRSDPEFFRPQHVEVQTVEETSGEMPSVSMGVEVPRNEGDGRHKGATRREIRRELRQ